MRASLFKISPIEAIKARLYTIQVLEKYDCTLIQALVDLLLVRRVKIMTSNIGGDNDLKTAILGRSECATSLR